MPAFSYDLGVFDPTFPGITLHFPNQATWDQSRSFAELITSVGEAELRRRNPDLPGDITVAQLVRHMAVDLNFESPLDEAGKEHLGRAIIDHDPDQAVAYLAVSSGHVHERRHFHDWLLSPYTAAINGLRAEVFINYAQIQPAFRAGGATVLPVPITRWLRKTSAEQRDLIAMWQSLLGDAVEVRVPDLTDPALLEVIHYIERRYKSIGILFEQVGGVDLDAAAIFEASALLIQTQSIHDTLGETAHNLFLNSMVGQTQVNRYTWFIRAMSGLLKPGEILEVQTLSCLATWCLLGNNTADTSHANPLSRLFHVVQHLSKCGFPPVNTPSHVLFTELDQSMGALSYRDCLTHSVQLGDVVLQSLNEMVSSSGSKFGQGVVQCFDFLLAWHKYMVKIFLDDPDGYAIPIGYLDRNLEKWPEPPVRFTFGQPFFRVPREQLSRYQRATMFDSESTPADVFLRQFIETFPEEMMGIQKLSFDIQVADNWQYLCGLVDTVFAEYNRDQPEIDYQRERSKKSGLYLLEVLR